MVAMQDPASPRKIGKFLVWLGVAIFAALLLFLVIFYYHGHKADVMKNSRIAIPVYSQSHTG